MATSGDDSVSADLAGFTDAEGDARERSASVARNALVLCEPLARMIGHKRICDVADVSKGHLSRELSDAYETRLSLRTALAIGRESQNEKLARVIVGDGLGMRLGEWQRRKPSTEERLRALESECRDAGAAGVALLDAAARRARSGR